MPQNMPVTREDLDELRRVLLESMLETLREMEARLLRAQRLDRMLNEDNGRGRNSNPMNYTEQDVQEFVDEIRAEHLNARQFPEL